MASRQVYWLAVVLVLNGLGLFAYKALHLGFPLIPGGRHSLWDVEFKVSFGAANTPVKVSLFIPRSSRRFAVMHENFVSRGYGLSTKTVDNNRLAVWSIRNAFGDQTLYYHAVVQKLQEADVDIAVTEPSMTDIQPFEGAELAAAEALLTAVREHSADLDTLVTHLLTRLANPNGDTNVLSLLGAGTDPAARIQTAVRVLALGQIPARMVRGIRLDQQRGKTDLLPWLQVYGDGKWTSFNPTTGEAGLPNDYLIVLRGNEPVLKVKGGANVGYTLSVRGTEAEGLEAATARGRLENPHLLAFSLFSLPIQTQAVYQILLTIPIGALLLVVMRNFIGIKTFGTFMPVLVGLAFRETELFWGILLFSLVVALGLSIRFYLERLKLLLVPRLAAVLIIVIMVMAFLSVLSHQLGLERGLSVALFPMIIMTMTIERMSIVWEERGPGEAIQQGVGSLLVAALAYLLMTNPYLEHLMFVFPELLLVLLAGTLVAGRYTGYRLSELRRFKSLSEPPT